MANWKYELHIGDLHDSFKEGTITIKELAQKMSKRIQNSIFYKKYKEELEPITLNLMDVEEVEDYDSCLEDLYNWADFQHTCWIDSLSS